jgi:TfoX/Sxy family transcriptional regulator of competence genes
MAYDEILADRVRTALARRRGVVEKRMFGGMAFMLNGNMSWGIVKDQLMVRVGPKAFEEALTQKHAKPMDFTGRPMKGMVYVDAKGIRTDEDLKTWVDRGVAFAKTLPKK